MSAPLRVLSRKFHDSYKFATRSFSSLHKLTVTSTDADKGLVRVTKQDKLHLIAINRPEKRNSVNPDIAIQLRTAFLNFEEDSNASIAVLHGLGGTFCAGYDLKELAAGNASGLTMPDGAMGPSRRTLKKPVIAAVDGYAVAGGFELALWCDLRVVEETAIMGVFCRRFGIPLIDGGAIRLPQIVGLGRALDLILTGRGINGKEAHAMGLVTKLCKEGQALETAINLANDLCILHQDCLNSDRLATYEAAYHPKSYEDVFESEMKRGAPFVEVAFKGAEKFMQGAGRHGQSLKSSVLNDEK